MTNERDGTSSSGSFDSTHWSVVIAAGCRSTRGSDAALAELCESYWYPLYAYARRRTACAESARDRTQEFFARLLEKNFLATADPQRGRFRAFLLTAFKHFLINEGERERALKRGGGRCRIALDFATGESRFRLEPAHERTPEKLYERAWARAVIDGVLGALRAEYRARGDEERFEKLKGLLAGEVGGDAYERAAAGLGLSVATAQVAVHRMRRRFAVLLHAEVGRTLDVGEDVEEEISALLAALAG